MRRRKVASAEGVGFIHMRPQRKPMGTLSVREVASIPVLSGWRPSHQSYNACPSLSASKLRGVKTQSTPRDDARLDCEVWE